jgi:predicted HAD superfamily Cof-like phosphohydrolase
MTTHPDLCDPEVMFLGQLACETAARSMTAANSVPNDADLGATIRRELNELAELREQVTRLQQRCTELVEENRGLRGSKRVGWDGFDYGFEAGRDAALSDVAAFHRAAGQPVRDVPTVPGDAEVRLRLRLIGEEFFELLESCLERSASESQVDYLTTAEYWVDRAIDRWRIRVDLPAAADALVDLEYVIKGTHLSFGLPAVELWDEVHASNMTKAPFTMDASGKVRKSEAFVPPDIQRVLAEAGWVR